MESPGSDPEVGDVVSGLADPRSRPEVIRAVEAASIIELAGRVLDLQTPRHRLVWDALVATTEPDWRTHGNTGSARGRSGTGAG